MVGLEPKFPGATAFALPTGIAMGMFLGAINGIGVAVLRVPSMIWTLGVNVVVLGCCVLVTGGFAPKGASSELMRAIGVGTTFGLPNAALIWFALAGLVTWFLFGSGLALLGLAALASFGTREQAREAEAVACQVSSE